MNLFGKKVLNHFSARCNICDRIPWFWLPRGHVSPVLKEFEVVGGGLRYVDCPLCGSSDRDRLVYYFLEQYFLQHAETRKNVLHIAPEKPIWKRWKKWNANVQGLDKRTGMYKFVYSKTVLEGDVTQLNFDDNTLDLIVCNHVLEHVKDEPKALKEIHRILKPGGRAVLQVPFSPIRDKKRVVLNSHNRQDRIRWVGQHDHVRLYAKDPWNDWLQYGFEFEHFNVSPKIRKVYFLNPREPLMLLQKSK